MFSPPQREGGRAGRRGSVLRQPSPELPSIPLRCQPLGGARWPFKCISDLTESPAHVGPREKSEGRAPHSTPHPSGAADASSQTTRTQHLVEAWPRAAEALLGSNVRPLDCAPTSERPSRGYSADHRPSCPDTGSFALTAAALCSLLSHHLVSSL